MKTTTLRLLVGCMVVMAAVAIPTTGAARLGGPEPGEPVAGAGSLGDSLLPQLGNGGYDVTNYTIELGYDPVANHFDDAQTTIIAKASANLSEFSFDFSVTLENWSDIWFNEGWANWSEWYWQFIANGGDDPADIFDQLYADTPAEDWAMAPAVLDGDPANLFAFFPTYERGAMTVQGYRGIVGDEIFFELARVIQQLFAYGNISTSEFIDRALASSGLDAAGHTLLAEYFEQWLYGEAQPTILPEAFD